MNTINTNLTTSGNSVAVRLPKELLKMSGLGKKVKLEAKKGQIIISKSTNPRDDWSTQIKTNISLIGEAPVIFNDMDIANGDGLDDLPWDGLSFEEWLNNNG